MNSKQRLRTRIILFGVAAAACVLAAALYWTQIVKGSSYSAKAEAQYVKPATSLFDRGTIFFQSKDGTKAAAATVENGYLVYMNPSLLTNAAQAYAIISQYLTIPQDAFMADASKQDDHYEELAHRVPTDVGAQIATLSVPGIGVAPEDWLSYPGGDLAAHELGLIGETGSSASIDGETAAGNSSDAVAGRYGLERSYESTLARPDIGSGADIFADLFADLRGTIGDPNSETEGDIVTTLEPTVQSYFEQVLAETQATWHPDGIGGLIMDPQTGDIVAMSSLPTFDPNDTSSVTDVSVFSNPIVEDVYEMGSIMKPLTMATGFDTGTINASSTYNDTGCMVLNEKKICNYDGRARGITDMQTILSQSLNIGAATVALRIGAANMAKYFASFGLGSTTGIDLPNEATGILGDMAHDKDIGIATAAYGQGIAVSPIEMARALSILANGGYLVQPHMVKEIDYLDGTVKTIVPVKTGPVLQPQTVSQIDHMLSIVADTALVNGKIRMDHYSMAAKTGTAEIPDPIHGGYYDDRYLHSFFGFLPAYNARFIIFLYQIYPKGAEYASATLTQPYDELAKFLINYYNIPPDR